MIDIPELTELRDVPHVPTDAELEAAEKEAEWTQALDGSAYSSTGLDGLDFPRREPVLGRWFSARATSGLSTARAASERPGSRCTSPGRSPMAARWRPGRQVARARCSNRRRDA